MADFFVVGEEDFYGDVLVDVLFGELEEDEAAGFVV